MADTSVSGVILLSVVVLVSRVAPLSDLVITIPLMGSVLEGFLNEAILKITCLVELLVVVKTATTLVLLTVQLLIVI